MHAIVIAAATLWITLHSVAGDEIYLNPKGIVTVRHADAADQGTFHNDARCIITTRDSKFLSVKESCEEVLSMINDNDTVGDE